MRETGTGMQGRREGKTETGAVSLLCPCPTVLWFSMAPIQ